jgi:chromosome segregation ATPase
VELRSTLAERESALRNARGFASELQQMYRDTLNACDSAEARVIDLEAQLHPAKPDPPPLVIVSPPPSSSAPKPFLAQPKPMTRMSPDEEAVVARLLTTIERLRGERDALRRDLHFAKVEHQVADDALRARLEAAEREVHRLEKLAVASQDSAEQKSVEGTDELRKLHDELNTWREKFERADAELTDRTAELASNGVEMDIMRVHLREVEDSRDKMISSYRESSRITISSLVAVQHLKSELDEAEDRLMELNQTSNDVPTGQQMLRAELDASNARFADAIKELEQRNVQITDMHSKLSQFESEIMGLECELSEARQEQSPTEIRYSAQQLSVLSSDDIGGAEALKSHLEELEQRILRRTEQIGMLQHDIKRLETNLRVAEETIGELTAEVETLGQERACLVDDCAQAREARDEAHKRIDELELELESLTDHRDELKDTQAALQTAQSEVMTSTTSLETMVHVLVDSATRSRYIHAALKGTRKRLATAEANVNLAGDRHSRALAEIEQLSSEIESMALTIRSKTADMDALTEELNSAKQETQRLSTAIDRLKSEAQSREQDVTGETQQHTATIEGLEGRLAAAEESKDTLSQLLEAAQLKEAEVQAKLEQVQGESQEAIREVQDLTSAMTSLEQELNQERVSHFEAMILAQDNFEKEASILEARAEESRQQYLSLQAKHANAVQELTCRLEETKFDLARSLENATSRESLECDLLRLEAEHADELLVLRSRLDESIGQADSLQAQVQAAAETIKDLEFELAATAERYDAVQVEIHGLEHALAAARTHVDEHDASIQALQREKTALQVEHTQLEAELDRMATKHQYVEQQAKRR